MITEARSNLEVLAELPFCTLSNADLSKLYSCKADELHCIKTNSELHAYITDLTRIWHVPAKHANRMDALAHSSSLAECAPRFMTRTVLPSCE